MHIVTLTPHVALTNMYIVTLTSRAALSNMYIVTLTYRVALSNSEYCVWRAVLSDSSHHPQEVLRGKFSFYVHTSGLKPNSFVQGYLYRTSRIVLFFVHSVELIFTGHGCRLIC